MYNIDNDSVFFRIISSYKHHLRQVNSLFCKIIFWVLLLLVDKTLALTLSANSTALQSVLPSLILPKVRFTNTGSCLEMEYRGDGIRLDIKTAKQNLTSLQNSPEWMTIKVNLDKSDDGHQV